jgi:hypothetical protein
MLAVYRYACWQIEFHNDENELKHTNRPVYLTSVIISDDLWNCVTFPIYKSEHIKYLIRFSSENTKKKYM